MEISIRRVQKIRKLETSGLVETSENNTFVSIGRKRPETPFTLHGTAEHQSMLLFKSLNCSSSLLQSPVPSSRFFPSVVVRTPRTLSVRRIRTNGSISMACTDDSRLKRIAASIRVIPDFPKPGKLKTNLPEALRIG